MIDRREFVQSMIALGAATSLRPATVLFAAPNQELKGLADAALAAAKQAGASYADIRINRYRNQFIFTRDRRVQNIVNTEDFGFGVRVIVDGTWGFASSSAVTKDDVAAIARQAVGIARANKSINTDPVKQAPVEAYADVEWNTPVKKDPFELPLQPKIDLLLQINDEALKVTGASFVSAFMLFVNEKKFFASSEGSYVTQSLIRSWPNFSVTSVDRDTNRFYQRTSLPGPMGMGPISGSRFTSRSATRRSSIARSVTRRTSPAPASSPPTSSGSSSSARRCATWSATKRRTRRWPPAATTTTG
jgi:TldD protein